MCFLLLCAPLSKPNQEWPSHTEVQLLCRIGLHGSPALVVQNRLLDLQPRDTCGAAAGLQQSEAACQGWSRWALEPTFPRVPIFPHLPPPNPSPFPFVFQWVHIFLQYIYLKRRLCITPLRWKISLLVSQFYFSRVHPH